MYVMCPLRQQPDDAGVAWVKHAIKFAWLRIHKDFIRHKAPIRFEFQLAPAVAARRRRWRAALLLAELEAAQRALRPHRMRERQMYCGSQAGGVADNRCTHAIRASDPDRRSTRRRVLLYASDQSEEQNMRTSERHGRLGSGRAAIGALRASSRTGWTRGRRQQDGRLLSVLFDPALVENRLASWGAANGMDRRRARQRDPEYLPPIEAEVDAVADAPAVRSSGPRAPAAGIRAAGSKRHVYAAPGCGLVHAGTPWAAHDPVAPASGWRTTCN